MTTSYEADQKQLEERVVELQKNILQIQERSTNINAFLYKVHQYTDIQKLDEKITRISRSRRYDNIIVCVRGYRSGKRNYPHCGTEGTDLNRTGQGHEGQRRRQSRK